MYQRAEAHPLNSLRVKYFLVLQRLAKSKIIDFNLIMF
jgi:hypothetical protein